MTMKAPVGPPICTRLPPSSDTTKPAITAVMIPFSGLTPEAMPKAMASGRATMPTMMPAIRSAANVRREYSRSEEISFGRTANGRIGVLSGVARPQN